MAALDLRSAALALGLLVTSLLGCAGDGGLTGAQDVTGDLVLDQVPEQLPDLQPDQGGVKPELIPCIADEDCLALFPALGCDSVSCEEGLCVRALHADGTPCDDGDACTGDDQCLAGVCGGAPVICEAAGPCSVAGCDPATGCTLAPQSGTSCDDLNPCTPSSTCEAGQCRGDDNGCACVDDADCAAHADADRCNGVLICLDGWCELAAGSVVICDASHDDACRTAICDPAHGVCFDMDADQGTACDDGDACTEADQCVSGECRGVQPVDCDDGNPCTSDLCDPDAGCAWVFNAQPCDDGDRCTVGDRCDFGQCLPGAAICACQEQADCLASVGAGACDGQYICDEGRCELVPDTTPDCPPPAQGACVVMTCASESGACEAAPLPDGTPCDDGDACSLDDRCVDGVCVAWMARACDDDDACTVDGCDPLLGCVHDAAAADGRPCADGNACTSGEACLHGVCYGPSDLCECFEDADCLPFEDGDPCDGSLACRNHRCVVDPDTIVVCDGGLDKPCVLVSCDPGSGLCEAALFADGTPCDDQDACTVGDHCESGACLGEGMLDCGSLDPCRVGSCTPAKGCVFSLRAGPCSDGDPCTAGDICSGGVCHGVREVSCEDGLTCTLDACEPGQGCRHHAHAAACDDGDACTPVDVCAGGACGSAGPPACDDGDPCTLDACDPVSGACGFTPLDGLPCEDGNACTVDDSCVAGVCEPGVPCQVDSPLACEALEADEGDPCNGALAYDEDAHTCVVAPGSVVSCAQTGLEPPCVRVRCDPADGACRPLPVPDGEACDDEDPCTLGDRCEAGICAGDPVHCEDGDPCTDDTCEPAVGCRHLPNARACDDGDYCTVFDYCYDGACVPGPRLCDCVDDTDCERVDDGDRCNGRYVCEDALCVFDEGSEVRCEGSASLPCWEIACAPASGKCGERPRIDGFACQEEDACQLPGVCEAGVCLTALVDCDDGNPCTVDGCDPASGCTHELVDEGTDCAAALGSPCVLEAACLGGRCVRLASLGCDDDEPCTVDTCDETAPVGAACEHAPLANGAPCDDLDACSTESVCLSGACTALDGPGASLDCDDGNPCTEDACDPESGCVHAPAHDGQGCEAVFDDACVARATCEAGLCVPRELLVCDDGQACTVDACDRAAGCVFDPAPMEGLGCDDGDACTEADACAAGLCQPGAPPACPEGGVCAEGGCDPELGCVITPLAGPCDDGDACTEGDHCDDGQCAPGSALDCDDGNPCSEDRCDAAVGCVNEALDGVACDDGNACTAGDGCAAGQCRAGAPVLCGDAVACTIDLCDPADEGGAPCRHEPSDALCDDGDPCTLDGCDALSGCWHELQVGWGCDDGDPCSVDDACSAAGCVGLALACDDGNPCTDDACEPLLSACVHTPNGLAIPCQTQGEASLDCLTGDHCDPEGRCVEGGYQECPAAEGCTPFTPLAPCSDEDAASVADLCSPAGACAGLQRATSAAVSGLAGALSGSDGFVLIGNDLGAGAVFGGVFGLATALDAAPVVEAGSYRPGWRLRAQAPGLALGSERALLYHDPVLGHLDVDAAVTAGVTRVGGLFGLARTLDGAPDGHDYWLAGRRDDGEAWAARCEAAPSPDGQSPGSWLCEDSAVDVSAQTGWLSAGIEPGPLGGTLARAADGAWEGRLFMAARYLYSPGVVALLGWAPALNHWRVDAALEASPAAELTDLAAARVGGLDLALAGGGAATVAFFDGQGWQLVEIWGGLLDGLDRRFASVRAVTLAPGAGEEGIAVALVEILHKRFFDADGDGDPVDRVDAKEQVALTWRVRAVAGSAPPRYALMEPRAHLVAHLDLGPCAGHDPEAEALLDLAVGPAPEGAAQLLVVGTTRQASDGACLPGPRAVLYRLPL